MKKHKMALKEEVVKYIFPGAEPEIAMGEDGYVAYDFKCLYPSELGVFLPIEIDKSNYSAVFPKSFESYFFNFHEEVDYLSRLLEVDLTPNLRIRKTVRIDCMFGKVLDRNENNHVIFRFDELIAPKEKTDLLCRVKHPTIRIGANDKADILSFDPYFTEIAKDLDGSCYFYFIAPVGRLLEFDDKVVASVFAYAHSLRKK